jgi:ATP dependent DNA ligase domain
MTGTRPRCHGRRRRSTAWRVGGHTTRTSTFPERATGGQRRTRDPLLGRSTPCPILCWMTCFGTWTGLPNIVRPPGRERCLGNRLEWSCDVAVPTLRPMLASSAAHLPKGPGWSYEVKWDGYRTLALKDCSRVKLLSRNLKDATRLYPGIARGWRDFALTPCCSMARSSR